MHRQTVRYDVADGILTLTLSRLEHLKAFTVQMADDLAAAFHQATEDADVAAYALAHRFVDGKSQVATALTRQMLYRKGALPSPLEAHRVDSLAMFYSSQGDGKEGVAAFREKRPPKFTGQVPADLPPLELWN
ncbi:hypothetical protein [Saccharopolyspora shandongensis]|uniref:hypothetical protein n=1 Tax=Saccharopolyspora shandongensis TaxID=418495 RepID=UPI0033CB9E6F